MPGNADAPLQSGLPRGELALIERIRSRARERTRGALKLGIGDDCAVLSPPAGQDLLVTTDLSLEERHFRRDWHSPASIGHRTLARGLSDLAAMGASPLAAFLSLALPKSLAQDDAWLDGFLDGLLALARQHNVPLAGGDTSESPGEQALADIVLLGSAPRGRALRRSGAKTGDRLYVTGALGGAAAELAEIAAGKDFSAARSGFPPDITEKNTATARGKRDARAAFNAHPHLSPQPRLAVGQALLRRRMATACIDLSDGLSTDLNHLCVASGVAAELDLALLPVHPLTAALDYKEQLAAVLHGGEDYELLFTARPSVKVPSSVLGVKVTRIGRIVRNKGRATITLVSDGERFDLQPQGWEHLR